MLKYKSGFGMVIWAILNYWRFVGGLEAYSNWPQVSSPGEHDGGRKMRGFVLFSGLTISVKRLDISTLQSFFFLNVWKNRFRICMTQHPGWRRTGLAHPTFGWARRFFVLSTLYYCSQANLTKQDLKLSAAALNQNQARFLIQILLNQFL